MNEQKNCLKDLARTLTDNEQYQLVLAGGALMLFYGYRFATQDLDGFDENYRELTESLKYAINQVYNAYAEQFIGNGLVQ